MPPPRLKLTTDHLRLLELNEGFRAKPYRDTVGKWTIGFGQNLSDVETTREQAAQWAANQMEKNWTALLRHDPWITLLDPVRQAAVLDLVYNLGIKTWLLFHQTRDLLAGGDYEAAAENLTRTKWYRQVKSRGPRICRMIATGRWPWET